MELRLDETGFGKLKIFQNPKEFCYGVDAVLLADFASKFAGKRQSESRIMDLGTGTGIVPIILSHKTAAGYIGGIEVQENSWTIACKNAVENQLTDRLSFFCSNVKDFDLEGMDGTFDLVTTNPPYTEGNRGIESANQAKAIARHELTASLDAFIQLAARLLKDKGNFCIVHRPSRLVDLCVSCRKYKLEPKELQFISGKPGEKPNILLMHCVKNGNRELRIMDPLFVHNDEGTYSSAIKEIYDISI